MLFTFNKKTVKKASAEEGAEHQAIWEVCSVSSVNQHLQD